MGDVMSCCSARDRKGFNDMAAAGDGLHAAPPPELAKPGTPTETEHVKSMPTSDAALLPDAPRSPSSPSKRKSVSSPRKSREPLSPSRSRSSSVHASRSLKRSKSVPAALDIAAVVREAEAQLATAPGTDATTPKSPSSTLRRQSSASPRRRSSKGIRKSLTVDIAAAQGSQDSPTSPTENGKTESTPSSPDTPAHRLYKKRLESLSPTTAGKPLFADNNKKGAKNDEHSGTLAVKEPTQLWRSRYIVIKGFLIFVFENMEEGQALAELSRNDPKWRRIRPLHVCDITDIRPRPAGTGREFEIFSRSEQNILPKENGERILCRAKTMLEMIVWVKKIRTLMNAARIRTARTGHAG
eukprot:GILK01013101.1.p2 GENE.GILK01013101.1~~GILK01013101.1.p2  ORF type:complete len:355 (+),score=27.28 GILK01013101.1:74-1138(+)